jgi:hypothetical protein
MDIAAAIRARHRDPNYLPNRDCKPTLDVAQVLKTFHGSNQGNEYLGSVHFANSASEVLAPNAFPIQFNRQFRKPLIITKYGK